MSPLKVMKSKVPAPQFNYEKFMLLLFPLITLGVFVSGVALLWAIIAYLIPMLK